MFVKPANSRSHALASTFTGISLTLKATPAVPMPSLVSWPMVPLTCVPWPSKSSGVDVSLTKSCGATMRLAAGRRDELRRGGIRDDDFPERRILPAALVPERRKRGGERGVLIRHPGVDDRDGDGRSGLRLDVPGLLHVDQRQVPLLRQVERIVGHQQRVDAVRDLRVLHLGPLAQHARRLFRILGRVDADDVEVGVGRARGDLAGVAGRAHRGAPIRHRRLVAELHDDAAGAVARARRADAILKQRRAAPPPPRRWLSSCSKPSSIAGSPTFCRIWSRDVVGDLAAQRQHEPAGDRDGRADGLEHEIDPYVYSIG